MSTAQLRCIIVASTFALTALLLGGFGAILSLPVAIVTALPCAALATCAALFTFTY